jgi:hypothetical protein
VPGETYLRLKRVVDTLGTNDSAVLRDMIDEFAEVMIDAAPDRVLVRLSPQLLGRLQVAYELYEKLPPEMIRDIIRENIVATIQHGRTMHDAIYGDEPPPE